MHTKLERAEKEAYLNNFVQCNILDIAQFI